MQWNWAASVAVVAGLLVPVHIVAQNQMALAVIRGDQRSTLSSSVTWVSLVASNGVRSEPIPVEVDSYNALYYRWSPSGQRLAFGKAHSLFIYDAMPAKTHALTNRQDRWELMPSWSPKGDSIAFVSRPLDSREGKPTKPGADPWVMSGCYCGSPTIVRPDGSGYRVLESTKTVNPPTWSPDGSGLAYDADGEVHVYNLTTNEATTIRPGEFGLEARYLSAPSWSPTRQELTVFFSEDAREPSREQVLNKTAPSPWQGFAILDLAHRKARVVYKYQAPFVSRPPAQWSSDGERIALVFTAALIIDEPKGLVVVDRTSNKVEILARHPYQAAWEPGGPRLAFLDADNGRQVHVLSPTINGWAKQAIQHEQFVEGIAWRPTRQS